MTEAVRICRKCLTTNPPSGFRRYRHTCRECERAYARADTFFRVRGLTHEQRDQMLADQGGVCGACGSSDAGSAKGWHVDHCHATEVVRAVLCSQCNVALGNVKDDVRRLRGLIAYLERHRVFADGDEE